MATPSIAFARSRLADEYGASADFVDRQTGFLAHTRAGGSSLLITHDGARIF
ncbi:MAG: hypothetical protein U0232_08295 [Thermomicrobiales bacterium]